MGAGASLEGVSDRALLVVLDGFGIDDHGGKNAVRDAATPRIDALFGGHPFTTIEAGGVDVGLPEGVVGNSEVGHMNLGAGRPVRQDLVRINEAVARGALGDMPRFRELVAGPRRVHLLALLSDGGVHSHIDHVLHAARLLLAAGKEVLLHAFMDGRDTQRDAGGRFLEEAMATPGLVLASMQGRSVGMDRDRRWDRIRLAYETLTGAGAAAPAGTGPLEWLRREHARGRFDEFVSPVLFDPAHAVRGEDAAFFMNFRPDRAAQLTLALADPSFGEFPRDVVPAHFLCMVPYVPDEADLPVLFDREPIEGGLSEHLSGLGLRQFKIAETEKYPHVTYFFNGGRKEPHEGEEFSLVPSPRDCRTYDEKPEMSAPQVLDRLLAEVAGDRSFLLVNFANGDMVGHTGNHAAAVRAVEVLDGCVGRLADACAENGVAMVLTADHGNCDRMAHEDGSPHTSHTGAPVPFSVFHPSLAGAALERGAAAPSLKDVAPTVLRIMGIDPPAPFAGRPVFL